MKFAMMAALTLAPAAAQAQDMRAEILEKVKGMLAQARQEILKKVEAAIDQGLAAPTPPADRIKMLEKRLADLAAEVRRVEPRLLEARVQAADPKLFEEARKQAWDLDAAREVFTEALADHNDKKFDDSVPKFKRVAYGLYDTDDEQLERLATSSCYNVACGYALAGKKAEAIDWLEITVGRGYLKYRDSCHASKLEHLEQDEDLTGLREEPRYKSLLARIKSQ
jgi:hypothetical protein